MFGREKVSVSRRHYAIKDCDWQPCPLWQAFEAVVVAAPVMLFDAEFSRPAVLLFNRVRACHVTLGNDASGRPI